MTELTQWLRLRAGIESADGRYGIAQKLLTAADEIERLQSALSRIQAVQGCECDNYEGHRCLLCKVREIAREGLDQ